MPSPTAADSTTVPSAEEMQDVKDTGSTPEEILDSVMPELDNEKALDELLDSIRSASLTARDFGTRFETLIRDWLTADRTYKDLFTKVQTYREWAEEHTELGLSSRDNGIDLVGTNREDPATFTAIQCKMYARDHRVSKADIDSFISDSDRSFFTRRFVVATNQSWTDNVLNSLSSKSTPVTVITHKELASSNIDWSAYRRGEKTEIARRKLRQYQRDVIDQIKRKFGDTDRGKLIMACGTGKTFTSMKLVEEYVGPGGLVLFLVPSLALLSQTLADWKRQCTLPISAFAVCSDSSTGKADSSDIDCLTQADQLSYPATTDPRSLNREIRASLEKTDELTVIFATYQSIDVVSLAQAGVSGAGSPADPAADGAVDGTAGSAAGSPDGFRDFDLIICDEAHRTAGGHMIDDDREESRFLRVHDNSFIRSRKRLYMTATPKIYGSAPKQQAEAGEAVLYSMDDERIFGPELASISFTTAIDLHCLVDYKVIVLTMDESLLEADYSFMSADDLGGISVDNAAKIVGAWRALSKIDLRSSDDCGSEENYMKRAVGFAQIINQDTDNLRASSKQYARYFNDVVSRYKEKEKAFLKKHFGREWNEDTYNSAHRLTVESRHIDGSMNATDKEELLTWLKEEPEDHVCRILFNVRCLSEGVDVPSLDAVIFLAPRRSPVDVVQTVGRVMRIAPGKKRGYVILPIAVPSGAAPDLILNNNREFGVVWEILNALKSIDPTFGRAVDGETGKINPDRIEVISVSEDRFSQKKGAGSRSTAQGTRSGKKSPSETSAGIDGSQLDMFTETPGTVIEEAIKTMIVKKVGNRREWEEWAEDVGQICQTQIGHIRKIIRENPASRKELASFMKELKATLNGELTEDGVIEMLGQHVVIRPVIAAVFDEYPFADQNPISKAMTQMLDRLDQDGMNRCTSLLEPFYRDVKRRMQAARDADTRQTIIKDLFDRFFKTAFPKLRDKLGIIYTPVEIVDFMNRSVADLLQKEFGRSISAPGVHILDPFTGTGTFIVRLMQSGLIPKDALKHKYENDLHANEIVPLAYYIAAMNMETAYHDLVEDDYRPNRILVWTDTFASNRQQDIFSTALAENNASLSRENSADIRVIIGNPPYSVGQESQNDDNANEHYEELDRRLQETYVARTNATLKNSLFDSYIRAYRWASDRIGDNGIIAFITNAGWLDSNSADGMRKCMAEEFSSIYIYHLKGNARTSGEQRRKEKDNVFGEGSRAPVALVFLVKNPAAQEKGKIYFHTVADYLSREEKLAEISKFGTISNMEWSEIIPDRHGDWLNQRDDSYGRFMRVDGKKTDEKYIFRNYSCGMKTNRDSWVYNSSQHKLLDNIRRTANAYNQAIDRIESGIDPQTVISETVKDISWTRGSKNKLQNLVRVKTYEEKISESNYRPFFKQNLYYDKNPCFVEMPGRWSEIFSGNDSENLCICVNQKYSEDAGCIALITDKLADLHFNGDIQCFPLYLYDADGTKTDAITDDALSHFREPYGAEGTAITKDDIFYYIYGILHSPEYRSRYANNLMKELPRIPRVATFGQFKTFASAGRTLADLHVHFEDQEEYPEVTIKGEDRGNYTVQQMKWGKIPGKTGNAAKDKTTLIYNGDITITGIPLEAQEYVVNKKSALDWIVERACVSEDKKSGIVNDFNLWGKEHHNERYPLALFLKVITVSLRTVETVRSLPKLEIHPLDQGE